MNMEYKSIGLIVDSEVDLKATHNIVRSELKPFNTRIKAIGLKIGVEILGYEIHCPRCYNHEVDSLDLKVGEHYDKSKLKAQINTFRAEIDSKLKANKSYDGYLALTVSSVNEELEDLESEDYSIDVLVLKTLIDCLDSELSDDFTDLIRDSIVLYDCEV